MILGCRVGSADGVPIGGEEPPPPTSGHADGATSGIPNVSGHRRRALRSRGSSSGGSGGGAGGDSGGGSGGSSSGSSGLSGGRPRVSREDRVPPHNKDWPRPGSAVLRLNHYMYRSRDFALRVKACRALPAAGKVYGAARNRRNFF